MFFRARSDTGRWLLIPKTDFCFLARCVKEGIRGNKIESLDASTVTVEQVEKLHQEGIDLVPEDEVVDGKTIKVLRVVRP